MSGVVVGIGASHSTLMNTHWDEVADDPGANRFAAGLARAREVFAAARPDVLVVIGSNHFRGLFLDLMPAVTIGVGEVRGAGEAGTPSGPLATDPALGKSIVDRLSEDFDPAFSLRIQVDHGITQTYQHLVPDLDLPLVPVVINMFAPPLPSLRRCHALGAAIGAAVRGDGEAKRVAVVASGGLSHRLPWPKWFETLSDDDRFLVEAWLEGRHSWKEYEVRRRQIIRAAEPAINSDFDARFLGSLADRDLDGFLAMSNDDIEREAGNGAQEIRSWVAMSAAVGPGQGTTHAYAAIPQWLTGMGVASIQPDLVEVPQ